MKGSVGASTLLAGEKTRVGKPDYYTSRRAIHLLKTCGDTLSPIMYEICEWAANHPFQISRKSRSVINKAFVRLAKTGELPPLQNPGPLRHTDYHNPPKPAQTMKPTGPSPLEKKFALLWVHGIKGPTDVVAEHKFHPVRRWKFDFAHVATKTAIEIEGGIWTGGRHTRGNGFENDCEKYNAAVLLGWKVFRLTRDMIVASELEKIVGFIKEQAAKN